jgi:hypothetical protein
MFRVSLLYKKEYSYFDTMDVTSIGKLLIIPFLRQSAHEGGKVVSPKPRPPLPPGNSRGTHFC